MLLHVSVCWPSSGSWYLSLAKVTIAKIFRKIRHYETCSGVAAYCVKSTVVCKLCLVQNETSFCTTHSLHTNMVCWRIWHILTELHTKFTMHAQMTFRPYLEQLQPRTQLCGLYVLEHSQGRRRYRKMCQHRSTDTLSCFEAFVYRLNF
jgi:hypothetical protein